jgi:integrase
MSQTMPRALTDLTVRAAKPPATGTTTLWDAAVRGFGLRCSQGGTKTFIVMTGKERSRVRIGHYPLWSLKDARLEAMRIISDRAGKPARKRVSFEQAYEKLKQTHLANQRMSTRAQTERLIEKYFLPALRTRSVAEIATAELTAITDKLSATPSEAVHAFAAARLLFRWALKRRLIDRSPLDGVPLPAPVRFRDRVLSEVELATVFRTCFDEPKTSDCFVSIVKLLILTGQRKSQIAHLRGEWISRADKTITWPAEAMKGCRPHIIPYGKIAATILDPLPAEGLLFLGRGRATAFTGFSKCKAAFDKSLKGVESYTLHDLRRSMASAWQRIGIPIEVTEAALAHRSGSFAGIVSVYQRHDYLPEMRTAVQKWEEYLQALLSNSE